MPLMHRVEKARVDFGYAGVRGIEQSGGDLSSKFRAGLQSVLLHPPTGSTTRADNNDAGAIFLWNHPHK